MIPRYLGVDPGCQGALAIIERVPAPRVVDILEMPIVKIGKQKIVDGERVLRWIAMQGIVAVNFELTHSRNKQGVVSTCTFCGVTGGVLAIIRVLNLPMRPISPSVWKKTYGLIGTDKAASLSTAKIRFGYSLDPHLKGTLRDQDKAEAALIGLHP